MICMAWGKKATVVKIAAIPDTRGSISLLPCDTHPRGAVQPCLVLARELRLDLPPDPGVIVIEPGKLERQELLWIDEAAVERHQGQRLEAQHLARAAGDLLGQRHQDQVLQPDTVSAFEIKPRLVGQNHAGLERIRAEP